MAGLLGALAAGSPAMAETLALEGVMHAVSYADLLQPIPNAGAMLQASDKAMTEDPAAVVTVQYHHHHHSMMAFPNAPKPA